MMYFFLIASIYFSSFFIGPFSIRVYSSILLFIFLLFSKKNSKVQGLDFFIIYIIYIFFVAISQMITGEFFSENFPKRFWAYDFVSIVTFYGMSTCFSSGKQIKTLIILFSICNIINAIVSMGQVMNFQWAWNIGNFITVSNYSDEIMTGFMKKHNVGNFFASGFVSGVFGDTVKNGYITASLTLLSMCFFLSSSKKIKFLGISSFILGLMSSFVIQQRAAFYMLIFSSFIIGISQIKRIWMIYGLCAVFALIFLLNYKIDDFSFLGRLSDSSNKTRNDLNDYSMNFIWGNFLFGGMGKYVQETGFHPHNYLFSGFILGGFMGGIAAALFYVRIIILVIKTFVSKFFKDIYSIVLCCILLLNVVVSFSHNTSIVVGDHFIWIFLVLLLKVIDLNLVSDEATSSQKNVCTKHKDLYEKQLCI